LVRHLALVIVGAGLTMAGCAGSRVDLPDPVAEEPQEPEEPRQAWNPAIAVEPGGRIFVTYYGGLGENKAELFFDRSLDGGVTWLPEPIRLYTLDLPKTPIQYHQIITNGAGKVWVVWLTEEKEMSYWKPRKLQVRQSSDRGATWDEEPITWQFENHSNYPSTVLSKEGELNLLWTEDIVPRSVPRFNRMTEDGKAWAPSPLTLPGLVAAEEHQKSGDRRDAHWPALTLGPRGNLYATWQERSQDLSTDILFNRSQDRGHTWLPGSVRLNTPPPGGHTSREPKIATDGEGGVYVVWEDSRHNTSDLYFSRSLDRGATWLEQDVWLTAVRPHLAAATGPILRADKSGHLYLLWNDIRQTRYSLYFTRSLNRGANWLPEAIRLDHHGEKAITWAPSLANDDDGHVYAVWWEGTGPTEGSVRFTRSSDYGATWLEKEQILDKGLGKEGPRWPTLTIDAEGVVSIFWSSDRSGQYQLYMNRSTDHGQTWLPQPLKITGRPARTSRGS
jgi:hypothetical protein